MKKEIIQQLHTSFEDVAHEEYCVEFWLSRELQVPLCYDGWRRFTNVLEPAHSAA